MPCLNWKVSSRFVGNDGQKRDTHAFFRQPIISFFKSEHAQTTDIVRPLPHSAKAPMASAQAWRDFAFQRSFTSFSSQYRSTSCGGFDIG